MRREDGVLAEIGIGVLFHIIIAGGLRIYAFSAAVVASYLLFIDPRTLESSYPVLNGGAPDFVSSLANGIASQTQTYHHPRRLRR